MATLQEVNAAMTGFPRNLTWANFRQVQSSPSPPHIAQMSATFSMGGFTVHLVNGEYKIRNPRITVATNASGSWATSAARSSAALLPHEQGHYDITGLIARDLIGKVLDLSLDQAVVAAARGSGNTPGEHLNYVTRQFQTDVTRFGNEARALSARLNTNPGTHADGIYDTQTNHGLNATQQSSWNGRLQRLKSANDCFELMLRLEGIIP